MEAWLLKFPVARGALLGAMGLVACHLAVGFITQCLWTGRISLRYFWVLMEPEANFTTMLWGALLGASAASSFVKWRAGERDGARRICKWSGAIGVLGTVLMEVSYFDYLQHGMPSYLSLDYVIFHLMIPRIFMNTALQASLLFLTAGFVLPRTRDRAVQVTEKLHL